jgi:hypothetical protein
VSVGDDEEGEDATAVVNVISVPICEAAPSSWGRTIKDSLEHGPIIDLQETLGHELSAE